VATIRSGTIYPIETDHLMAPLRVLDASNAVVWSWEDREAFGATPPTQGTVGGVTFSLGLRFPGQWSDTESGLVSNGFRDYDPSLGKYVEVDPLGLAAGMNPYIYVSENPLIIIDSLGLCGADSSYEGRTEVCSLVHQPGEGIIMKKLRDLVCKNSIKATCGTGAGADQCCNADFRECTGKNGGVPMNFSDPEIGNGKDAFKYGKCIPAYTECMSKLGKGG
jgi:RHS repeat-associated protein